MLWHNYWNTTVIHSRGSAHRWPGTLGQSVPQSNIGCWAPRKILVFCLGPLFPCHFLCGSGQVGALRAHVHLHNGVATAFSLEDLVWQAQWQANRHPINVPPLLPPQKHISSENGSQQKNHSSWKFWFFPLQRICWECICFVHKRSISNPMWILVFPEVRRLIQGLPFGRDDVIVWALYLSVSKETQ